MTTLFAGMGTAGRAGAVACGLFLAVAGSPLAARDVVGTTLAQAETGTETGQSDATPDDSVPAAGATSDDAASQDNAAAKDGAEAAADTPDVKQIKLTNEQVQNFISAQTDLAAIASKIQAAGDKANPALQAELEGIATKHGFRDFAELDDVAANISIVMAGLDADTGAFVDPVEALHKEREGVEKDASIPDTDKKQLVDELTEAINTTPRLQYQENIEIVKAHRAEIEKALQ